MTAEIESRQQELAEAKQELQQHTEREAALARDIADRNRRLQAPHLSTLHARSWAMCLALGSWLWHPECR